MYHHRIREIRERNHLQQVNVAEILGCSQQAYSDYERGTRRLSVKDLVSLANYYQVSTDYLLGLTDETIPYPPPRN